MFKNLIKRLTQYPTLSIYCDGACWGNGTDDARASYGLYCIETLYEEAGDGSYKGKATNNTGELTAIYRSLVYAKGKTGYLRIFSDSQYAINSVNRWALTPLKKNFYLIKACRELLREFDVVEFEWVKGHNMSEWNEYVDALATRFLRNS